MCAGAAVWRGCGVCAVALRCGCRKKRTMANSDVQTRLAAALNDAIGTQARTYLAKVNNAANLSKGRIQAFSEVHGTVNVLCKTTDKIASGDMIHIRMSGPE